MSDFEDAKNRRSRHRNILSNVIDVIDQSNGETLGLLVNITTDGLMLVNPVGLKAENLYQISLNLSVPVLGNSEILIGVDCLWSRPSSPEGDIHWSGCQIIDISDSMLASLEDLIIQLATQ